MEPPIFNLGYTLESPQKLLKSLYSRAPLGPWSWVHHASRSTVSQKWVHDPKRTKVESKPMAVETELHAYRSQGREGSRQDVHSFRVCDSQTVYHASEVTGPGLRNSS